MNNLFGGSDGEERNALMQSLFNASGDETGNNNDVYEFLEKTPKTSLISELVDELHKLGYKIVKLTT